MAKSTIPLTPEERKARERERCKQWRADNPEKYKASWKKANAKQYQKTTKEQRKKKHKKWRDANKEHIKQYQAELRAANVEHYRKRSRENAAKYRAANPEHFKKRDTEYRKAHPDRIKKYIKKAHLKRHYGLTVAEHEAMIVAQNSRCAICGTGAPGGRGWHVDHCHETNALRKLLCNKCNLGLGHFQDSITILQRAADYLTEFATPDHHRLQEAAQLDLSAPSDFPVN
jgi:hypothetical protein